MMRFRLGKENFEPEAPSGSSEIKHPPYAKIFLDKSKLILGFYIVK
jgi:hypothetical protein